MAAPVRSEVWRAAPESISPGCRRVVRLSLLVPAAPYLELWPLGLHINLQLLREFMERHGTETQTRHR